MRNQRPEVEPEDECGDAACTHIRWVEVNRFFLAFGLVGLIRHAASKAARASSFRFCSRKATPRLLINEALPGSRLRACLKKASASTKRRLFKSTRPRKSCAGAVWGMSWIRREAVSA